MEVKPELEVKIFAEALNNFDKPSSPFFYPAPVVYEWF